jgi:hydrogenase maturation protein HypF
LAAIADFCYIGKEEKWLLESPQRPIVLLKIKKFSVWMNEIAPQQKYLGAILAYSPLHYLIFYFLKKYETLPILVMTSANKNDFALVADERELTQIKEYADYFLVHNRPIHTKCDDSIARVFKNQEILIRKARGYTPDFINFRHSKNILSCGAELKNTFSIAKGGYLISSPYLGDLKNYRNYELFLNTISRYKKNFCFEPEVIAYDLNSAYLSTQYALSLKQKTKFAIQHHHAHIAACRFENDLRGETIGICFDGAGLGLDNAVWGGEFFITDKNNFIRAAHFKYFGLLGADKSAQEPARAAFSILYDILKENLFKNKLGCLDYFSKRQKNIFLRLMENKSYVLSSSAGRLFDAAASLLNIKHRISYEAEAAILLEMFSSRPAVKNKSFDFYISKEKDKYLIDWQPVFLAILDDLSKGEKKGDICYKFHLTFAKIIAETAELLRKDYGINNIVLSGGVFQNFLLLGLARQLLQKQGFKTYYHKRVPTNDSGISVGQAVIANTQIGTDLKADDHRLEYRC